MDWKIFVYLEEESEVREVNALLNSVGVEEGCLQGIEEGCNLCIDVGSKAVIDTLQDDSFDVSAFRDENLVHPEEYYAVVLNDQKVVLPVSRRAEEFKAKMHEILFE